MQNKARQLGVLCSANAGLDPLSLAAQIFSLLSERQKMLREILLGDMDRKGMHPQQVETPREISQSETLPGR